MAKIEAKYLVEGDLFDWMAGAYRVQSMSKQGHKVLVLCSDGSAFSIWATDEVELVNL
jgi:hypothetical protein